MYAKSLDLKRSDKKAPPATVFITSHEKSLDGLQVEYLHYFIYVSLCLQYLYQYPQPPFHHQKNRISGPFRARNSPRSPIFGPNFSILERLGSTAAASPKTISSTSSPSLPQGTHQIEVLHGQLLFPDRSLVEGKHIYPPLEPDTCKHACGAEWRPVDYLSLSDAIVSSSSPLT